MEVSVWRAGLWWWYVSGWEGVKEKNNNTSLFLKKIIV